MVVEASVLVVGDDKEGFLPHRAGPKGLIDSFDKDLSVSDVRVSGMVVVLGSAGEVKVARVDEGNSGKIAALGVSLKGREVLEVPVARETGPADEEGGGNLLEVVGPGDALLLKGLPDGLLGHPKGEADDIVGGHAVGSGGVKEEAVRHGGPRDRAEPAVEDGEFAGKGGGHRDSLGRERPYHLLWLSSLVHILLHEAGHEGGGGRGGERPFPVDLFGCSCH